jgi:hypothetical protein
MFVPNSASFLIQYHYVRNTQPTRACMKNGDAQIAHLRHRLSYYRVILDVLLGASLNRKHLRCALVSACIPLEDTSETRFKGCQLGPLCH